jgi:hypothetical protein
MDIDKLTEQILEITNNSGYGWIDLDSSDADRIRVALTSQLTLTNVSQQSELLPKRLSNRAYRKAKTLRYEEFVKWWDEQV